MTQANPITTRRNVAAGLSDDAATGPTGSADTRWTRSGPPAAPAAAVATRLGDLMALTKMRVTVLVVITAWLGFALGAATLDAASRPGGSVLLLVLAATAMACMGASALNQVLEREPDSRMKRTANRPIAAGRMSPGMGTAIGCLLAGGGVAALALGGFLPAAAVCLATVLLYVLVYTPWKRLSWTATLVGAVPGALPPVIGYAAATGRIGPAAVAVFALMFAWQMPHFMAIAWLYREDYARGGYPFLAVVDPSGRSTFRQMLLWAVALLPIGVAPWVLGIAGVAYLIGAVAAGLGFLLLAVMLVNHRSAAMARATFYASLLYLPIVLVLMVADHV